MPLIPLPADNTKRYFLVYAVGGFEHRWQVRVADSINDASAVSNLTTVANLLKPELHSDFVFTGLEVALKGSNIRNPVGTWLPITGTGGTAATGQLRTATHSMRGRSQSGRKIKILLFGVARTQEPDFELTPAPGTGLGDFIQGVLNTSSTFFLTIDGTNAVWKPNVLQDYNDHFEKEVRP